MEIIKFRPGQRVITPEGEGEITAVRDNDVEVRLNAGKIVIYPKDKVSDDSDS